MVKNKCALLMFFAISSLSPFPKEVFFSRGGGGGCSLFTVKSRTRNSPGV